MTLICSHVGLAVEEHRRIKDTWLELNEPATPQFIFTSDWTSQCIKNYFTHGACHVMQERVLLVWIVLSRNSYIMEDNCTQSRGYVTHGSPTDNIHTAVDPKFDYMLRLMVGNSGFGKTTVLVRYTHLGLHQERLHTNP